MRRWNLGLAVRIVCAVGILCGLGCHRTFSAAVSQPNPLLNPMETLRDTEVLTIVTGDMDLERPIVGYGGGFVQPMHNERYPLINKANFTVVSRDRLRFHVQIEHKWKSYTDLRSWNAVLYDDKGRVYRPVSVETRTRHLVETWSTERRTAVRDDFGKILYLRNDGYKDRQPLGNLSVFRGKGDLVFYHEDIFRPDVRGMTLEMERSGVTFRFSWRFADEARGAMAAVTR